MGCSGGKKMAGLSGFLPQDIHGWQAEEPDKTYGPETIFDYIDGAGEVYRAYNFRLLLARRYVKKGHPIIIADLFDMGTSRNAFGVFSHDLEGEDVAIGQGSRYKGGLLSFWKGRYFVSVYTEEETPEAVDAVLSLGKKVDAAIPEKGERPFLASLLPREGLRDEDVHFFYNHLILNYHYFVADENILMLGEDTEAVLGTYSERDEAFRILVVGYPHPGRAEEALKSFLRAFMPEAVESHIIQTEDDRWTGARRVGRYLVVVFGTSAREGALEWLGRIEDRIASAREISAAQDGSGSRPEPTPRKGEP